jgi:hypothetical protein
VASFGLSQERKNEKKRERKLIFIYFAVALASFKEVSERIKKENSMHHLSVASYFSPTLLQWFPCKSELIVVLQQCHTNGHLISCVLELSFFHDVFKHVVLEINVRVIWTPSELK